MLTVLCAAAGGAEAEVSTSTMRCALAQHLTGVIPGLLHCTRILYHLSHQGSPPVFSHKEKLDDSLKYEH